MGQSPTEQLTTILGFDPAKKITPDKSAIAEIIGEISKERANKAREAAKQLLTEAIKCQEEFKKIEDAFNKQKNEFEKKLKALLKTITAGLEGTQPEAQETEKEG